MMTKAQNVLTVIMGGGKGTRLYPLTAARSKPAVPFASKYRLVDIPLSNSINAGFKRIFVLTQFNSASLHRHIVETYVFDSFSHDFVAILAAEQRPNETTWYQGTADAVRKNLPHFRIQKPTHYLILSGDQLYRMDLQDFLQQHINSKAEMSIAATTVNREEAVHSGILSVTKDMSIQQFIEKPPMDMDISNMKVSPPLVEKGSDKNYLASMGIYCFDAKVMEQALDNTYADFGKEIVPMLIHKCRSHAYVFNGFWEDIGTIRNFYQTSIDLTSIHPNFNLYDETMPIYTHRRDLPPSKLNSCTVSESLAAPGCIITQSTIHRSVIGIRTIIREHSTLNGVICMGADYYEENPAEQGETISLGIGANCSLQNTIIDKNARIGDNCSIGMGTIPADGDYEGYFVRDGIIIIPKNAVIPAGTEV